MSALAKLKSVIGMSRLRSKRKPRDDHSSDAAQDRFFAAARALPPEARVVEFGTKQSIEGRPTHVRGGIPNVSRANYLMVDIEHGEDVDVVADLHALPVEWEGRFDAVIALAVFEHLERPWIAAKEISRILLPGGFAFISTHQTFPIHGYPSDFFRFSKEALSLIFLDAGLKVVEAGYRHRAEIIPPPAVVSPKILERWNDHLPSYILVDVFVQKD